LKPIRGSAENADQYHCHQYDRCRKGEDHRGKRNVKRSFGATPERLVPLFIPGMHPRQLSAQRREEQAFRFSENSPLVVALLTRDRRIVLGIHGVPLAPARNPPKVLSGSDGYERVCRRSKAFGSTGSAMQRRCSEKDGGIEPQGRTAPSAGPPRTRKSLQVSDRGCRRPEPIAKSSGVGPAWKQPHDAGRFRFAASSARSRCASACSSKTKRM
jgi:hypothetical protein